jgi:electron transfer flavoprotein beta subunit
MNIYVCVKQVPDTETKIELKSESSINDAGIKWIANPFDEYALEEALKLKEKKIPQAMVVAVSLGPQRAQETIRFALAMGADYGIHILTAENPDHILVAKALAGAIKKDGEFLAVFTGKQAIDDDAYQVHIRIAKYLGIPVATNVTAFEYAEPVFKISREIEEGALEKLEIKAPAVIAVTKGINTPRYPTVPNIMKAKKKEIKTLSLPDVGIPGVTNSEEIVKLTLPGERVQGKILKGEKTETVPQLIQALTQDKKII